MTEQTILIALSIFQVIVLAFFIYRKDKFQKEPLKMLVKAFLLGCLSALPAAYLETLLTNAYSLFGGEYLPGFFGGIYNGYVVAGCSEELCKLLLLYIAVWRSPHFDEYFDGIVYATFLSLGFAGLENVLYVFSQGDFSSAVVTGSMRALLSVPGHFLFGVAMGYYFALAKFEPTNRSRNIMLAFLVPMLLHGTFDALLMIPDAMGEEGQWLNVVMFPVFIWFDIKLWKLGMRRLRSLQQLSEEQNLYEDIGDDDSADNHGSTPPNGGAFSGFNWEV